MVVSFHRCSPKHPLVAQAPLVSVEAPFAAAWLWQTSELGLLVDDIEGRPTTVECITCIDALLGLGRVSFLSATPSDFSGEHFELVDGFGIEACVRSVPILSKWSVPALVSIRSGHASPELFFAFGNWSLGSQALLLMTEGSHPDQAEREFLLNVSSGQTPTSELPNLLAWLVPMVDGCGIIAFSRASRVIDDIDAAFLITER